MKGGAILGVKAKQKLYFDYWKLVFSGEAYLLVSRRELGNDAEFLIVESAGEGFVFTNELDASVGGDLFFHLQTPVGSVDDETAEAGAFEVFTAAHGGVENTGVFASGGFPVLEPGHGKRFFFCVGLVFVAASHQGLPPNQGGAVLWEAGAFLVGSVDLSLIHI